MDAMTASMACSNLSSGGAPKPTTIVGGRPSAVAASAA
jgi:hypothetical protein